MYTRTPSVALTIVLVPKFQPLLSLMSITHAHIAILSSRQPRPLKLPYIVPILQWPLGQHLPHGPIRATRASSALLTILNTQATLTSKATIASQ